MSKGINESLHYRKNKLVLHGATIFYAHKYYVRRGGESKDTVEFDLTFHAQHAVSCMELNLFLSHCCNHSSCSKILYDKLHFSHSFQGGKQ